MTLRYVLARQKDAHGIEWWSIRELYEDADGRLSWTTREVAPGGESAAEVFADLRRMAEDATRPYLDLTQDPPQLRSEAP